MRSCCIYYWDNSVGVKVDSSLIKECLDPFFECIIFDFSITKDNNTDIFNYLPSNKFDIGIFVQNYEVNLLEHNKINVYIVNEEWLSLKEISNFDKFDYIIVKNSYAKNLLFDLHNNINVLYFWSRDLYHQKYSSIKNKNILHFAGKSIQKNTESLLDNTSVHIFDSTGRFKDVRPENYYTDYISDNKLQRVFNTCDTHICPSLYEAHGHYMYEGLLCNKNIIASDIPPWSEQIDPDYINFIDTPKTVIYNKDYNFLSSEFSDSTCHPLRRGFLINKDEMLESVKSPKNKKPRKYILSLFQKNKESFINFFTNL